MADGQVPRLQIDASLIFVVHVQSQNRHSRRSEVSESRMPDRPRRTELTHAVTGLQGTTTTITGWSTASALVPVLTTINASVTVKTGTGTAVRTMLLQRAPAGSVSWSTVATTVTTSAGRGTVAMPGRIGRP